MLFVSYDYYFYKNFSPNFIDEIGAFKQIDSR